MAGFGGAVKLTGESEYRKALAQITQNLKEVSSQMNLVASSYDKNDKSIAALTAKENVLNLKLAEQTSKLNTLKQQYASMQAQYEKQTAKHGVLVKQYELERTRLDEIGKALGTGSKEYAAQRSKVEELAQAVKKSTSAQDANEQSMSKMRVQMMNAQADINRTARELDNLGNEAEDSGRQAEHAGDGYTVFKNIIANLASVAIVAAINGLKKLGGALVGVGKQAYASYAEYEQLVGGVETLFGESADTIKKYAADAYKTAGISANEYMEQATSFSATLLQGLGGDTKKAAEYANMAISDMSDNANKMGTSMTMIQNAYQGFAKDNYTMLDNLKLGYGGTQAEMARLINDTGVLGDEVEVTAETVKDVPFDKIIEAIHKVQQNIGITGTTTKEAAGTIEGSTKAVKASWQNLLVGIADENANLQELLQIFVDNVVTMAKNGVPKIQNIVKGLGKTIVSLAREYMPQVTNTILPTIEKIISLVKTVATFIINNFSTIAPVILSVATAFTVLNAAMSIGGTISAVTTAISGLTAGVGLATKAQTVWNAVMSANPIGAVLTAVVLLTTAIVALSGSMSASNKEHEETMAHLAKQRNSIDATAESWDHLKEAQQKSVDSQMTQVKSYENLYDELMLIVDANGKVKDGYDDRASFITATLSEALGVEISLVDGVIQEYGTLKDTIDEVMEKKKAQIILDSQETLYKEAIENQTKALQDFRVASDDYLRLKSEMNELEAQYSEALANYTNANGVAQTEYYEQQWLNISKMRDEKKAEFAEAEELYTKSKETVSEYAYNIGLYEQNMAAAHAGNYDQMSTVNWEYVKDYQAAGDAEKKSLEDQIANTEANLNLLKEMKEQSGEDIYDSQIRAAEKQLNEQKDALRKYTSATDAELKKTTVVWSDSLDDQLSEITGAKVEFKESGNGLVQMFVDGVVSGEPKSKEEMAKLVTDTINEVSKQKTGAQTAGEDLIQGINNGITNQKKQSGVFSAIATFGASLLSTLKASLLEQSPSKATREMGQFLLEGLGIGIDSEETDVLRQIKGFGKKVIGTFNAELGDGVEFGAGLSDKIKTVTADIRNTPAATRLTNSGSIKSSGTIDARERYDQMVDAFKDALSQVTVQLDDEVAGGFVEKTVTRAVYSRTVMNPQYVRI